MSNKAARYWRADGGYQDVPAAQATPAAPPPGYPFYQMATMQPYQCYPGYQQWQCQPQPEADYQRFQYQWQCQPNGYIQGPIGVGGLWLPPPRYEDVSPPPPSPWCCPPAPPKEDKKKDEKKDDKKGNPYAPPKLPEGANYLFDKENMMVHIFNKAAPVWSEKYRNRTL